MGALEKNTIGMTFFITLLLAYGIGVGGSNVSTALNGLFAPWPSINQNLQYGNCYPGDLVCVSSNIAKATGAVALAIEYPAILFFTVLGRINAFISALVSVLLGPEVGVLSVPFLDGIFLGIIVLPAAYELFRMVRGNASAGTM